MISVGPFTEIEDQEASFNGHEILGSGDLPRHYKITRQWVNAHD
jgi:hypothetical protein